MMSSASANRMEGVVYGGTADGRNRLIVRARSAAQARRFLAAAGRSVTPYYWRRTYCETVNEIELRHANTIGQVWEAIDRHRVSAGYRLVVTAVEEHPEGS